MNSIRSVDKPNNDASHAPHAAALPTFADAASAVAALRPDVPLQCFRPHVVAAHAVQLQESFGGRLLYALKANPHPVVVEALWNSGIHDFDVASIGEIRKLRSQFPSARLYFMNPVKSRQAIRSAYRDFVVRTFSADSETELDKILFETGSPGDLNLMIRIAVPNRGAMWKLSNKFGATRGEAVELLRRARRVCKQTGLAFHVGSLCLEPAAYGEAIDIAAGISAEAGVRLDVIDIGGGLPAAYEGVTAPPLASYMHAIESSCARLPFAADVEKWCEAGRVLSAPGASLVVRVLARRDQRLYINDGIFGSLGAPGPPPPRFGLPCRVISGQPRSAALTAFTVFGPTCDGMDHLAAPISLPSDIAEGDWIEIGQHGAYGAALRSDFNGFAEHQSVVVSDGPILPTPEHDVGN